MSSDAGTSSAGFLPRFLTALSSCEDWRSQASIAAEAWVNLAGVSAATFVRATGANRLELLRGNSSSDGSTQFTAAVLPHPCGTVLDGRATIQLLADTGLASGLNTQVQTLPELATTLVVQTKDAGSVPVGADAHRALLTVSRNLLSLASGGADLIPDARLLEAMAEFAAGAGHEINNPLASILGQTQLLLKTELSAERRQALEMIGSQAWRIRDMIGNSMLFARPPAPQTKQLILADILNQAIQPLTILAENSGILIEFSGPPHPVEVVGDQSQLATLVSLLVRNSIEALLPLNRAGRISVSVREAPVGIIELSVVDDGTGIQSEEARRHMFSPFFSGRSAGRGLGFGLCLAWQITRSLGGLLIHDALESNRGTGFYVAWPKKSLGLHSSPRITPTL